jgi:hypothetical protein
MQEDSELEVTFRLAEGINFIRLIKVQRLAK